MTLEQTNLANLGRGYWQHYVNINGYAFSPNRAVLSKLSKHLGITYKTFVMSNNYIPVSIKNNKCFLAKDSPIGTGLSLQLSCAQGKRP